MYNYIIDIECRLEAKMGIDNLIQRTKRYEFSDGLRDLQFALVFMMLGLFSWVIFQPGWLALLLRVRERLDTWAMWAAMILMLGVPALLIWLSPRLLTAIRQRWLWRETGMVQPHRIAVPRRVTVTAAILGAGIIVFGALWRGWGHGDDLALWRIIWLAAGWATGCTLIGLGRAIDLPRFVVVGITGSALSTLAVFLALTFPQVGLFFGLSWGIVLVISGTLALRRWQGAQA